MCRLDDENFQRITHCFFFVSDYIDKNHNTKNKKPKSCVDQMEIETNMKSICKDQIKCTTIHEIGSLKPIKQIPISPITLQNKSDFSLSLSLESLESLPRFQDCKTPNNSYNSSPSSNSYNSSSNIQNRERLLFNNDNDTDNNNNNNNDNNNNNNNNTNNNNNNNNNNEVITKKDIHLEKKIKTFKNK